jgi:hypothetical protein
MHLRHESASGKKGPTVMGATIVKVIDAKDGVRRAVIGERPDGTFQV